MASDLPLHEVTSSSGQTLKQYRLTSDTSVPAFKGIDKRLEQLATLKTRPDDIWVVTYPKCGTHWLNDMIVKGYAAKGVTLNNFHFIDLSGPPTEESYAEQPRQIIMSHLRPEVLPKETLEQNKLVMMTRNPRDTIVSHYNHMKKVPVHISGFQADFTFQSELDLFTRNETAFGSYFEYMRNWWNFGKTHKNLLIISFEECKQNPKKAVQVISDHLEMGLTEAQVQEVVDETSFEKVKAKKADSEFYRKGVVGDWENWFNDEDKTKFQEYADKECKGIDDKLKELFYL